MNPSQNVIMLIW